MSDELDLLWTLRGLDENLAGVGAALRRVPEERGAAERRLALERARLEQAKTRFADLQKKRRAIEQEVAGVSESERKFQSQLPSIKKNEEYTALLHEIEAAKRRRSDLETEVLLQLEAEDREQAERPAIERAVQALERETAERMSVLDAEERAGRERAAALEAERQTHMADLSPALRARYERVRASLEGRAVVAILKGACGGCYRGQPPQVLQEARRRDRVLVCEGCGRLLLWPPEGP